MADVAPSAEKAAVQIKDVAVALMPDRRRAPVLNEKLMAMNELLKKGKGESIFKAAVAEKDDDMYVNFTEMRQMADGDKLPGVRDEDQPARWKRLDTRVNIYDKWLNDGLKGLTPEENVEIRNVLVEIPGFCEVIVVATGGRLSFEQAKNYLTGKGGAGLNQDEKQVVTEILSRFLGDGELKRRIEKSLSGLSTIIQDNDTASLHEINGLREKIKEKEDLVKRKTLLKESQQTFKNLNETDKQLAEDLFKKVESISNNLKTDLRPATKTGAGVNTAIGQLTTQLTTIQEVIGKLNAGRVVTVTQDRTDRQGIPITVPVSTLDQTVSTLYKDKINEQFEMLKAMSQLESLKTIFSDVSQANLISAYEGNSNATAKLAEVDGSLAQIGVTEKQLIEKEGIRNKYADKYKRKLERTLSEEIKRHWNDVKLADAAAAAEADAAAEKETKGKREALAKATLDKYLHLSFIKYKNGKAVGMCDDDLKKFVKKDMLSRSPAQLSRDLLERINTMRYNMPPAYAKEMKKTWDDAGVGKGTPPLTFRQALDEIGQDKWEAWAAEKVPDVLGYAYDRKYYFDRLKLTKAQGEFLKRAYIDTDFFQKAHDAKDKYMAETEAMLGTEFVNGKDMEKFKQAMGGDWVNGTKRAMKTLAVAGAVGAGAFTLAGGLGYPMVGGLGATLQEGAVHVFGGTDALGNVVRGTLPTIGDAALGAVSSTSRVAENLIGGVALGVSNVTPRIMPGTANAQAFKAAGNFYIPGLLP